MVALEIRSESRFGPPIDFPVLFVHHQNSDCQYAVGSEVVKNYDKLKAFDKAPTEAGGCVLVRIPHVSQRRPRSGQGD